jgi:ABC-type amino acid transport substrate-binding protein
MANNLNKGEFKMKMFKNKSLFLVTALVLILAFTFSACGAKKKVDVKTAEDLKGLTVGCQVATTADDSLQELAKTVEFKVKKYDQIIQTFADLKTGRLDAIVVDEVVARDYVQKHPKDYKVTSGKLTNEPIGVCFKKENDQLRNKVNFIIDEFGKDGTLKDISAKWFGEDLTGNIENVGAADAQGTSDDSYQVPADKKKFRVGVDNTYPPMEYLDGTSTVGFDIDFATAIAKKLNLEIEIVPTAWDGIFTAVNTDKFDCIISSVSINEDRLKNFSLSKPYIANAQVIVTRP